MAETGRPTDYTEELALEICTRISTSDKGLNHICLDLEITPSAVYRWIADHEFFKENYARARELQADFLSDQIVEIADDSSNDTITIKKGDEDIEVENREWVNRSKLRVDARKWKASKLAPKKYGDKLELDNKHSGKVQVEQITGMKVE